MFFKKQHPIKGYVYAVTTGTYAGQLFVFIDKNKNNEYEFLSLPEMVSRVVPKEKFEVGLTNKIIDTVERLPKNIYATCVKQYRKNRSSNK
jgi:hypothetical protein